MVFVVLLSIIGFALLLTVVTKRDLCLCLFATVPGFVGLLYLGAFLGPLRATAIVVFYAGLAAGPAAIALAFRKKRARVLLGEVLSPGPLLFVVSAVIYWAFCRDATFGFWDEFNNWGVAVKEMFTTDSLPIGGSRIVFQDYPRGAALFQYFFVRNAFWSEGVVYFAHFVLQAVPFVALFRGYRWRQAHWVALTLVFVLLLLMRGLWLRAIYVDFALAAYFGAVLFLYLTSSAESSTIALLIPSLFMMPLIKKPGFGFALVCVAVICADLLLRRLLGRTGLRWRASGRVAVLALVVLAPLAAQGSWQIWVSATGLRPSFYFGAHESYLTALESFSRRATPFELETRQAFVAALSARPIGLLSGRTIYTRLREKWPLLERAPSVKRFTALEYTLISLALFAVAFWTLPSATDRIRLVTCVAILFAGFAAYLVCLLADYLMGFNRTNARELLEFHRYVWGYLVAVVMLAWVLVAAPSKAWPRHGRTRGAIAFAVLFVFAGYLYVFENPQYLVIPTHPSPREPFGADWQWVHDALRPRIEFTRRVVGAEDTVYIVYQDDKGPEFQFVGYQLFPLRTNQQDQTEKSETYEYDPVACGIPAGEWARRLTRFSYVFLARNDSRFWEKYAGLFDSDSRKTDFLFRVSYKPSGEMVLKPVR